MVNIYNNEHAQFSTHVHKQQHGLWKLMHAYWQVRIVHLKWDCQHERNILRTFLAVFRNRLQKETKAKRVKAVQIFTFMQKQCLTDRCSTSATHGYSLQDIFEELQCHVVLHVPHQLHRSDQAV